MTTPTIQSTAREVDCASDDGGESEHDQGIIAIIGRGQRAERLEVYGEVLKALRERVAG